MASRKNVRNDLRKKAQQPNETKSPGNDMLKRYDPTREILVKCLEWVTGDATGSFVENPAIEFTKGVKDGKFDSLNDEEYNVALDRIERLSVLWHKQPRRMAGEILLSMLERITIPKDRLESVAALLMEWYDWEDGWLDGHGNPRPETGGEAETSAVIDAAFTPRRPVEIRDIIAERVIGQKDAVKAAAMIVYNQLAGRRTSAVFCGPSGSGKTEIWRVLDREWPGLIKIIDASRLAADGWAGSLHIRDAFQDINKDKLAKDGIILVLDEADKILCEKAVGASGTDHNRITQNNLLRLMDGDRIEFGTEHGQPVFSVDASKISIVALGAFENLLNGKVHDAKRIGFGAVRATGSGNHKDITYDDLINAGMRQEIAGRANRIVALDPLSAGCFKSILEGPALADLEEAFGCRNIVNTLENKQENR